MEATWTATTRRSTCSGSATSPRATTSWRRKFFDYYGAVFADGALSVREKALIALAVSHAVQCPYCIDAYSTECLKQGADLEQMTEAVHVAYRDPGRRLAGPRAADARARNPVVDVSTDIAEGKHLR